MNPHIRLYDGSEAPLWDTFVESARNGTIFHTRKFLSYHPEGRFHDHSILFYDGEKLVAVLPAALKGSTLVSHPGASYGGLVVSQDTTVAESGALLAALLTYAKEKKFDGISMLRIAPVSLQQKFSEDIPYWLYQTGYAQTRVEMDGAITLSSLTEATILTSLSGKCRNMVRQAERAGISVRLTSEFQKFWPILEGVLSERHGAKPTHTLSEIQKLHELLPEHFRLLAAYRGTTMVGGIVLITIHSRALYTLYMAQEYASQKDHPMHMLLTEAMRLCLSEKRSILHLGVSTEDGGKQINEGLLFFKESFGCMPVRRESWEIRL